MPVFRLTRPIAVAALAASIATSGAITISTAAAATAVLLSGPTSGTTSVASASFTVSANGTLSGSVTVTPAATGATFSPTSVTISPGTPTATFTVTFSTSGTKSITLTNTGGLSNPTPWLFTVSDPVAGGVWQQITIAAHSRKVIGTSGSGTTTFSSTYPTAVDAIAPSTVQAVPYRSFCRPVQGEPGRLYYHGSLHSNYPGNEIDRIDVRDLSSTVATTTISHQPRVPPEGADSGYGSGSGAYVYAMYGTPLADTTLWQPYAHHTWTKNGWHPVWGYYSQITYALGDGATVGANPAGSGTAYQQTSTDQGLVSYDFAEGKYHVRLAKALGPNFQNQGPGISGMADWSPHRMSVLALANYGGYTYVAEVVNTDSVKTDIYNFNQATLAGTTWGWADATSGNGVLIRWLEGSKYLALRADFNKFTTDPDTAYQTVFLINLADATKTRLLTPPSGAMAGAVYNGNGNLTFCVDRNSRRIFWCVFQALTVVGASQFFRFYVSTFDDPMTWTLISTTGLPTITHQDYQSGWLASNREPMHFYNGHLFLCLPQGLGSAGPNNPGYTDGALNLWRCKVDSGAALPSITFNRYDYWAQNPATSGFRFSNTTVANLQMIGTKHVNWAYDPVAALYRQQAGDFGMSTCQSMCTLAFDTTSRGYTFTETLNENTNAPAGKVRPSSPDDGHWFYVPTDSAFVEARGKFVWMRGGDGEPMFYNAVLRAKYGASDSNGTNTQIATAISEGWDIRSRLYLFDQTTNTFTTLGASYTFSAGSYSISSYNGWTQDNGLTFWSDVWSNAVSSSASRNGYFDPVTGCLWRFYNFGSQALACFNFTTKVVKMFNISNWISPDTGRQIFLDGLNPPTTTSLIADGTKNDFCWFDSGAGRYRTYGEFSWEHKATWIDPATGYLYVVSPGTGYLWRFDTRGTHTSTANGWTLPFGPVGQRMPLVGTYPTLNSRTTWPPAIYGGDVRMNSLLFPFKGGLLYLSCNHHDSGVSGEPHYAFWRSLTDTGAWSVVTMPQEFAANAGAAKTPYSAANDEVLAISQAYTDIETRQFYRYFWKIT